MVSAIAGVASAVAAFMGGGASPQSSAAPPAVTVTAVPPAGASAAGTGALPPVSTPAAPAPGADEVHWSGPITLGLEGIDLSQPAPERGTDPAGTLRPAAQRTGGSGMMIKGTVAQWTGPGEPTAQGCRDLLRTRSQEKVDVVAGDRVCTVDGGSPIALLKVTKTHSDQGGYGELDADLTVWNLRK
ncbi:hypothetical protein [Kitasatospora camelliae]|uniref:Serine/threonine protein kinase n=1 Tax=Kitasatospora camelliae TaxID=3156397 RepID=A0AAU8K818_9ACTN